MRWVAFTGPPRVIAQISWKSVKVNSTEKVITTAAIPLQETRLSSFLTGAESALLQLFATHAGRPFSRADLCKRLNVALERSIDVQVTRLRRKIEEDPKLPLYLQTVRGVGYMLVPDRA